MKKLKYAVPGLLSIVLLPLSTPIFAQAATLADCQAIADRQARYDCYDSLDAAAGIVRQAAPADSNATSAPRGEVRAPQKDERSLLGRILNRGSVEEPAAEERGATAIAPQVAPQRSASDATGKPAMVGTVAALDQLGPNVWVVTLESGQRWQQIHSKRYNLEKGDQVTIYPTRWGDNYRLSAEKAGGYIQVKRIH